MNLRDLAAAVLLCSGLCLTACNSSSSRDPNQLVTGKVDTAVILQSDPQYMAMAQEYLSQQTTIKEDFFKRFLDARHDDERKQQVRDKYLQAQRDLDGQWKQKTLDFLRTRHSKVHDAAKALCLSRGIDMVVIDTKLYPTVEYGGVDITQEILSGVYGAKAPTPEEKK